MNPETDNKTPETENPKPKKKHYDADIAFLSKVMREKTPVTIFLVGGGKVRGTVEGFSTYSIIIKDKGKELLVFKHGATVIMPSVAVATENTETES